jgi:DNA-directed RNA polymerase subunit M
MRFCDKCGSKLRAKPQTHGGKTTVVLVCGSCGFVLKDKKSVANVMKQQAEPPKRSIKIVSKEDEKIKTLPTIRIECPKCGNKEAGWWLLQTRAGDEPPTQFYRCTNCSHTWRNYS